MSKITSQIHFDKIAGEYDYWKKKNWYYHDQLKKLCRSIVPAGSRVLEIGCGTGHILASLEPICGHGIDVSENIVKLASRNYAHRPELKFEAADILEKNEPLDYNFILMVDVIEHIENLDGFFAHLTTLIKPPTKLLIFAANPLWEPTLMLAEKLHMKMPEGPHKRLSIKQNEAIFSCNSFRVTGKGYRLLIPKKLPGADWLNRNFHKNPLLAKLGFGVWWVLERV